MGEKGEGTGGKVGGNWGERGRELGMGYPPVHPLCNNYQNHVLKKQSKNNVSLGLTV